MNQKATCKVDGDSVLLRGVSCFDVETIFESGQNFRFLPADERRREYRGVAMGRPLSVRQLSGDTLRLYPCTQRQYHLLWRPYFDMDCDYLAISRQLRSRDEHFALASDSCSGLRILRQEPFETVIGFIVSANNHVQRIRGIMGRIAETWGQAISAPWGGQYAFPEAEALACADENQLRELGAGYRDRYIVGAARMIASGEVDLGLAHRLPAEQARKLLMKLPGVGEKVADCIMLFSLDFKDVFPADTWVKRIAAGVYNKKAAELIELFSPHAGYAQQLLFHYHRVVRRK
ncbi:MAG: DNA glycosylase [Christensenellales bacterium]